MRSEDRKGEVMNDDTRVLVHGLVASQLRVDEASIADDDRFEHIGLDPLDLVLVVLRLERYDYGQGEFPIAALECATTVGDLVLIVDVWLHRETATSARLLASHAGGSGSGTG
jgi:hypothetical protein